ncbi:MAG TPA: carbon starvation CstA family protein [Terrimicrobiaceae bacterium]
MSISAIAAIFIILISAAYFSYGRWISRLLALDNKRSTPAHKINDGGDFVPTKTFYLFGQHFSAIAAAGPIAGPIAACLAFGWLPCLLWIAVGVVLIGAVHDFTSLAASVRHGACSIAEVAKERISSPAGRAMMAFIWIALVYVIVAFADITAGSFVSAVDEIKGVKVDFNPGGAVAAASIFYLLLSIVMGVTKRLFNPPLWLLTAIFVPATFVVVYLGTWFSYLFSFDAKTWAILICGYCFVASLCPVWLLLQPRGYLGGFVLYAALAVGLIGVFFGGYSIQQPAFKGWDVGGLTGSLFPFLFVTIACGACSGFHGLVCSGTTSKQIDKESDMHTIGYGAMLAEGLVAVLALSVVMIMSVEDVRGLKPGTIYGNGLGEFLTLIIGKENLPFAITFGAMAFSTFVFDTLDVATRLGRYLLQELLGLTTLVGAALATLITVGAPALILSLAGEGSWLKFWTLFGASNQLLAALTLLSVTMWLKQSGKPVAFTLVPMIFVLVITLWALVDISYSSYQQTTGFDASLLNAVFSAILIVLALFVAGQFLLKIKTKRVEMPGTATSP